MKNSVQPLLFVFALFITLSFLTLDAEKPEWNLSTGKEKIKVFILAGQSNMEGRGFPEPLTWQVSQEKYRERYTHFIQDGDYAAFLKKVEETRNPEDRRSPPTYLWSTRKDVWINYLGKHGDLTVGYGAPREGFGPEFNFGHVVGDEFDEQVLLIKCSWGGRALARGFLPPSSQLSDEEYARQAATQRKENEAWNKEQKAKVDEYNRKAEEENKTAVKKKKLRTFKARPVLSDEEYRAQWARTTAIW